MIVRAAYTDSTYMICRRHYDMDTALRGAPRVALGPVQDARDVGCAWCAREDEERLARLTIVGPGPTGYYHIEGPPSGHAFGSRCSVVVRGSSGQLIICTYESWEQAMGSMEVWSSRADAARDLAEMRAAARVVRS